MEEKILQTKKNGMTMLLLTLLGYVAAVVVGGIGFVMLYTTFLGFIPLAIAVIYAIIGIFLFAGLKVLKPEEGAGADLVRRLHRHPEGGGLLLGQSLLHGGQPRRRHRPEPER